MNITDRYTSDLIIALFLISKYGTLTKSLMVLFHLKQVFLKNTRCLIAFLWWKLSILKCQFHKLKEVFIYVKKAYVTAVCVCQWIYLTMKGMHFKLWIIYFYVD